MQTLRESEWLVLGKIKRYCLARSVALGASIPIDEEPGGFVCKVASLIARDLPNRRPYRELEVIDVIDASIKRPELLDEMLAVEGFLRVTMGWSSSPNYRFCEVFTPSQWLVFQNKPDFHEAFIIYNRSVATPINPEMLYRVLFSEPIWDANKKGCVTGEHRWEWHVCGKHLQAHVTDGSLRTLWEYVMSYAPAQSHKSTCRACKAGSLRRAGLLESAAKWLFTPKS